MIYPIKNALRVMLIIISLSVSMQLSSQEAQQTLVTESFVDADIKSIFTTLTTNYGIKFYYKDIEVPRRKYSLTFSEEPMESVIQKLVTGTQVGYVKYRDYAYAIMPKKVVDEIYTAEYYQRVEEAGQVPQVSTIALDVIGNIDNLDAMGNATITGTIIDDNSQEPIIGANILWTDEEQGTTTDINGKYTLVIPAGVRELKVGYLGYQDILKEYNIQGSGELNINMLKAAVNLDEVTISAKAADAQVENVQVGVTSLDIKNLEKLPAFMGETDVVKSLLLSAGVSSVGEGSGGFNVRGGDVDQNLILQDEGFLFNSSHALGFFSTFNADLIRSVDLYKGNIPAQFGGRLASVMDVKMRDGNFDALKMKASVGPVSSKIMLETPIIKGKTSFIGGFRSSYTDWILNRINVDEVKNSSAFFTDFNGRITHKFNNRNAISISGYGSEDEFTFNNEFGFEYSTKMAQLELRNGLSERVTSRLSVTGSRYESIQRDLQGIDASDLENNIQYVKIKEQVTYFQSEDLKVDAGISGIQYEIEPGNRFPREGSQEVTQVELETEQSRELAGFLNTEMGLLDRLLISAGVRYSYYQYLGPKTIYEYANPERPLTTEILGSSLQEGTIASYNSFEPRISMRLKITESFSAKGGYSRTSQFINQIFNTDSPTPTSQWQLSSPYIEPNRSHNVSFGFFKNFSDNNIETSIEAYGRRIDHLYDYRDFADLIVNDHIETELLFGEGRTYGVELSMAKKKGKLNGSISYTLSRSEKLIEGINGGSYFPSNFDKTHDGSLLLNYQPNQRNTLTFNFTYSTGRPTTAPIGTYETPDGLSVAVYSERNQLRIPDYHRLDIAYTLGRGYKKNQKFRTSWTFAIYNVYARRNAFSVFFTQDGFGKPVGNRLSVLGSAFPSLTLNVDIL